MDLSQGERNEDGGSVQVSSDITPLGRWTPTTPNNRDNNDRDFRTADSRNSNACGESNTQNTINDNSSSSANSNMNHSHINNNLNTNHNLNHNKYTLVNDIESSRRTDDDQEMARLENGHSKSTEAKSSNKDHVIVKGGSDPGSPHLENNDTDHGDDDDDDEDDSVAHTGRAASVAQQDWTRAVVTSITRQWLSTWYIYVIILTPILLLPIILCIEDSYQKEARCGYVIAVMAVYWTTEALPISITALLPVVLLPMLGVMTARETSGAFFNDVSMLFVGGLLVAIAIEVWDVHKRIALLTVRTMGAEPKLLLLGVTFVTWFLSMWISNTATTAMMMTIVQALLDQYRTVYFRRDAKLERRSVQEHARITTELSPQSKTEYTRLCKAVCLTVAYASNIGGTGSLTGTGPNIIFFGAAQELFESKGARNPVTFGTWLAYGLPMSLIFVFIQWVWLTVRFLRCKGGWTCCLRKNRAGDNDLGDVNAVIEREYQKLGPISYAQKTIFIAFSIMVVCWVTRDLGGAGGWGDWFEPKMVTDSTPSILFGILMFVLPSRPPRIRGKGGWKDRYIRIKPLLNWDMVHEKMPWTLYLVLGGGYAIAKAATRSGLSAWLGTQLLVFQNLNHWVIVLIICYVVTFATEVTSNSATATLMMPILSQMALSLQVNPLLFMYPAAIATSFAFMLPAATPPNAIVFATGTVRVIDMFSTGLMLNLLGVPILLLATATWGNALFGLDTMPVEFITNNTIT